MYDHPKVIPHVNAVLFTLRQNTTANMAHTEHQQFRYDMTTGSRTQWQQWKLGWQKCAGRCPGSLMAQCLLCLCQCP